MLGCPVVSGEDVGAPAVSTVQLAGGVPISALPLPCHVNVFIFLCFSFFFCKMG